MEYGVSIAFLSGMLGMFHCLGMCGGVNGGYFASLGRASSITAIAQFHSVRIGIYILLGVLGAVAGQVLVNSGFVGKLQGISMMIAGVLLIVLAVRRLNLPKPINNGNFVAVTFYKKLPSKRRYPNMLAGLVNGLVPCSLVFSVAVQAAATADPLHAASLMLAFGLGTLPAMFALSYVAGITGKTMNSYNLQRIAAVAIFALGIWTFYQGFLMYDIIRGLANW